MSNVSQVVRQLQKQKLQAQREIQKLDTAIKALTGGGSGLRRKPRFSAAARARIAAAQRARWAKIKAAQKK